MDQMDSERTVIFLPLYRSERAGRAIVVDAKHSVVCEVPQLGQEGAGIAQAIVDAMNHVYAGPRASM